jgi:hypothetical protein
MNCTEEKKKKRNSKLSLWFMKLTPLLRRVKLKPLNGKISKESIQTKLNGSLYSSNEVQRMTTHSIDVTYDNGNPAKMLNIFFGDVLLQLPDGTKIWVPESRLDHNWRKA